MKAHIARNQNAGVPLALGWNLSPADRGKLEGMAPAFGMKLLPVAPADAGKTVAQLLGEVEIKAPRTLVLEPGAYPPAEVLANVKRFTTFPFGDPFAEREGAVPPDVYLEVQHPCWSCNSNSSSANASAGVR